MRIEHTKTMKTQCKVLEALHRTRKYVHRYTVCTCASLVTVSHCPLSGKGVAMAVGCSSDI